MIQVVEDGQLGEGQKTEEAMAKELGIPIFRIDTFRWGHMGAPLPGTHHVPRDLNGEISLPCESRFEDRRMWPELCRIHDLLAQHGLICPFLRGTQDERACTFIQLLRDSVRMADRLD